MDILISAERIRQRVGDLAFQIKDHSNSEAVRSMYPSDRYPS